MALHLFSTPVECTHCGTVVNDPMKDRCPGCGELLKERRAPRRLAGVEERYKSLRMLLAAIRFLAVIVLVIGGMAFFGTIGDPNASGLQEITTLLGALVGAVALFAMAAFFDMAMDLEENTRATFRLQQLILEELQEGSADAAAGADSPGPEAAAPSTLAPQSAVTPA
jgi:hypothetical protein